MSKVVSHRENSKVDWGRECDGLNANKEDIQLGCLLRIADASEAMAKEHTKLIRDRECYERLYRIQLQITQRLERTNAALRGVITKMKRSQSVKDKA
jgi:hypothetical protein